MICLNLVDNPGVQMEFYQREVNPIVYLCRVPLIMVISAYLMLKEHSRGTAA